MPRWDTVAILGVGLLGGSLGLGLRNKRLARKVVGIGRSAASLKRARNVGAVDTTTTDLKRGVKEADLVVVCTPVAQIADFVRKAAKHCREGALITDVGSTKESIVAALPEELPHGVEFVGSHPLAGSEKAGVEFARADLFQNRVVVVTPVRRTTDAKCSALRDLWEALGARVVKMSPAAHDAAVATTSHVPHLVASVLAAFTPEDLLPLTAGGWLDTTRVAAGDPELWRQILTENRSHVLKSLAKFEKVLRAFHAALEVGDQAQLRSILEAGKQTRDSLGS